MPIALGRLLDTAVSDSPLVLIYFILFTPSGLMLVDSRQTAEFFPPMSVDNRKYTVEVEEEPLISSRSRKRALINHVDMKEALLQTGELVVLCTTADVMSAVCFTKCVQKILISFRSALRCCFSVAFS